MAAREHPEFVYFTVGPALFRLPSSEYQAGRAQSMIAQKFSGGGYWIELPVHSAEAPTEIAPDAAELAQRDQMADQPDAAYDTIDAPLKYAHGSAAINPEWESYDQERQQEAAQEPSGVAPQMDTQELISAGIRVDVPFELPPSGSGIEYDDGPPGDIPDSWHGPALFERGNAAWSRHVQNDHDSAAGAHAQSTDGEEPVEAEKPEKHAVEPDSTETTEKPPAG